MIENCRSCFGPVKPLLSLGSQYVSDFVKPGGNGIQIPLVLVKCGDCQLVQLGETADPEKLYSHFWYQSAISSTMRGALKEIAESGARTAHLQRGDRVLDIGCNDGTLFDYYPGHVVKVGFEPAINVAMKALGKTRHIYPHYFSADRYLHDFQPAKLVTAIAMFYDLDNPNGFVEDVVRVLADNGVFIIQMNYLPAMLENNGYDNICHEHLEYYSLTSLEPLLRKHGLEPFRVLRNDVNGGSFRVYISHHGQRSRERSVEDMKGMEEKMRLDTTVPYQAFEKRIRHLRKQLVSFVKEQVAEGKRVYVYGASTRGNILLQYCDLHNPLVLKAADANPEKWGRETVGTRIPIVSKEEARRDKPDFFLVLPYHFLDEIRLEEDEYLAKGGRLIVPLPEFRVIGVH